MRGPPEVVWKVVGVTVSICQTEAVVLDNPEFGAAERVFARKRGGGCRRGVCHVAVKSILRLVKPTSSGRGLVCWVVNKAALTDLQIPISVLMLAEVHLMSFFSRKTS